jgi:hypothetical protein
VNVHIPLHSHEMRSVYTKTRGIVKHLAGGSLGRGSTANENNNIGTSQLFGAWSTHLWAIASCEGQVDGVSSSMSKLSWGDKQETRGTTTQCESCKKYTQMYIRKVNSCIFIPVRSILEDK